MTTPFDAESTLRPGHILGGKYRVERVLGMGGMGVVVAARHVELETRFAIKLMRREAARDEESVERFLREARAAVKLKSQHCVQVVDVGKLEGGAPYMVMELLVGQDLAALVESAGARSPPEAVDYILQACEGIAEAHSLGIIHRDIKPQNLFVSRGVDGKPLVKVLDFGLAKTLKATKEIQALTQTTAVMGSPMYMSPEQMRASRQVDTRSDTWSLGVCLYELLTGRGPFSGETYPELCSMVLNEAPAPMPTDIPRGLAKIVLRCLEKNPRRRYADVAELATALEEFASAPGAAERIRAVLDAPRPQMESMHEADARPPHDPDAETKTAASMDTVKRARPRRGARWPSLLAGAATLCAGIVALFFVAGGPAPSSSPSSATPRAGTLPVPSSPPQPTPPPSATAAPSPVTSAGPAPAPANAADPSASRPVHARSAPPRRAPAPPPTATVTAPAKPPAPVLTPKTTEF